MAIRPQISYIELCAGTGMLGFAIEIACEAIQIDCRPVCYVEREAVAAASILERISKTKMGEAPVWDDVKTFDGAAWRGKVDCITAGYPCQPFFERPKLIGVEIKVSRQDFKKGVETGQFLRYDKNVSGVYVATPKGLIKTSELPEGIGHLVIYELKGNLHCVCRRHPTYLDVEFEKDVPWRIMFKVFQECQRMMFRKKKNSSMFNYR